MPKLSETNRLLADEFVNTGFDRAKPASKEKRSFFERALRVYNKVKGSRMIDDEAG